MNEVYFCIPERSRVLFFAPDTPKVLCIRYKPAPHQKVNQQTCDPNEIEVKSPKTRGRQLSIKDISFPPEAHPDEMQMVGHQTISGTEKLFARGCMEHEFTEDSVERRR